MRQQRYLHKHTSGKAVGHADCIAATTSSPHQRQVGLERRPMQLLSSKIWFNHGFIDRDNAIVGPEQMEHLPTLQQSFVLQRVDMLIVVLEENLIDFQVDLVQEGMSKFLEGCREVLDHSFFPSQELARDVAHQFTLVFLVLDQVVKYDRAKGGLNVIFE